MVVAFAGFCLDPEFVGETEQKTRICGTEVGKFSVSRATEYREMLSYVPVRYWRPLSDAEEVLDGVRCRSGNPEGLLGRNSSGGGRVQCR
jgi:hypothetical protein